MSLWYKQPETVTFSDIDAFCAQQIPEGIRLDYKLDIPNDISKLVAAFSNTLGGIIVLGVDADKTTNKPIWPPTRGMKKVPGIEERITSQCRDSIYPPIRPQISPIIDNHHVAGMALAVLRVDESIEAPHAVKGLIYERTGSQGTPYTHSNIDRITHLLGRRDRIEEQRRELVSTDLKRAVRQLAEIRLVLGGQAELMTPKTAMTQSLPRGLPLRWASVIPVYPWRDLCSSQSCFQSLQLFQDDGPRLTMQKVPGGAFARRKRHISMGGKSADAACYSLSTKGHVFAMECATEIMFDADQRRESRQKPSATPALSLEVTAAFATRLFDVASRFYTSPNIERPGHLILSIGLVDVLGSHMVSQPHVFHSTKGQAFLDDDFETELWLSLDQFLDTPAKACAPLFDDLRFGFDL